jgi:Cdc6-like AAA superfamily ATPase
MLAKSAADIKALQIEKADLISSRLDCLPTIATDTRTARELIESLKASTDDSLQRHALSTWLTHLDYSDRHRQISQSRLNDTGQWLLHDPTFLDWAHGSNQVLICTGVPGVGKTVTTSAVINSLLKEFKEDATVAVIYVYCSEQFKDKESTVELLGSLILQLLAHLDIIPKDLQESFEDHSRGRAPLNQEDASALLELVASKFA